MIIPGSCAYYSLITKVHLLFSNYSGNNFPEPTPVTPQLRAMADSNFLKPADVMSRQEFRNLKFCGMSNNSF